MYRFSHRASSGFIVLALTSCNSPAPPTSVPRVADPQQQVEILGSLVERYWAETAALTPWYSWGGGDSGFAAVPAENVAPQSLADALAIEQRYLAEALVLGRPKLDEGSALTYDIFLRERTLAIEGFTFPAELMPVDPFDGMPLQFALLASRAARFALSSDREYERWRIRSMSFVRWTNQAIWNMRDGVRRGYTAPRVLVEESLAPLAALGKDSPDNLFLAALQSAPTGDSAAEPSATEPERARSAAAAAFVKAQILPAYRALLDFLQHEYLPMSRNTVGWSELPLGEEWYRYLVKRAVGAGITPTELHALGLKEVERLHQRIQELLNASGAGADAAAFEEQLRRDPRYGYADGAQLIDAYRDLKQRVAAGAPGLFPAFPRNDFAILRAEAFRAAVVPDLSIRPRAPNGILAATLYVNVQPPTVLLPAAYLREAVPGRLYQLGLQGERADLPRFRRFGGSPAFIAGWGLYAATLGEDLGVDRDPGARFGALQAQLDCALELVLDTALHAQGWSRQRAQNYLQAEIAAGADAGSGTVDRIIARPAEGLACTVGYLKIQALRNLAAQRRGAAFDLRVFHGQILAEGAIPLDLLESKIKAWLDRLNASTGPAAPATGALSGGASVAPPPKMH